MSEPRRMVLCGVGGTGSWLAHGLARALQFQAPGSVLVLVDGDSYEDKNLERQLFETLGNKAHAMRDSLTPLFSNVFVVSEGKWIVDESDVDNIEEGDSGKISPSQLLNEGDTVFLALDNFPARKLILDAARNYDNIDIFTVGNGAVEDGDPLYGTISHYCRRDGVEVTEHPSVFHDEFVNPPGKNPGSLSCAERAKLDGGSQVLAVNMAVASQTLAKVSQFLFGTPEQQAKCLEHSEICFDLADNVVATYDRTTQEAGKFFPMKKQEMANA